MSDTIVSTFTQDGKVSIVVTYKELQEIQYALECVRVKREKSREYAENRRGKKEGDNPARPKKTVPKIADPILPISPTGGSGCKPKHDQAQ